jgi:hypothetical protein
LSEFENPPAVALAAFSRGARGMDRDVAGLSTAPGTACTTAPEPSVPEVSTLPNSWILHKHPVWLPVNEIVTVPLVGEAPMALYRVVRFVGVAMVPQVTVATWTHVSPLPETLVGRAGAEALELVTHMRIRLLAVGLMLAVTYELALVVTPPVVNSAAVMAAAAVSGRRISASPRTTGRRRNRTSDFSPRPRSGAIRCGLCPPITDRPSARRMIVDDPVPPPF